MSTETKQDWIKKIAWERYPSDHEDTGDVRNAFIDGCNYPRWIIIENKSIKMPQNEDFLLLFDNGQIYRNNEEQHPFAIATHWQPLPEPPIKK